MPDYKTIGVIGGMGPEATQDLFFKIINNTKAARDQDHLPVIISSIPQIPDRTPAIFGDAESPIPAMAASCDRLDRAGADFAIMPCVSAHYFIDELTAAVTLPILSMFDAVADHIAARGDVKKVGLIATTGTVFGGAFAKRLAAAGLETVVPDKDVQDRIQQCIYDIKASDPGRTRAEITADLARAAQSLVDKGAQGIIAGCTEIPLALSQADMTVPYFDSLVILARAAVVKAGGTLRD